MTIEKAINDIDRLKPNAFSFEEKVQWLTKVDGIIKREIIDTHEGGDEVSFTEYEAGRDNEKELLVPAPYDDLYTYWLESRIDYANGEIEKYNNSASVFNSRYSDYEKAYNRSHPHKGAKVTYF